MLESKVVAAVLMHRKVTPAWAETSAGFWSKSAQTVSAVDVRRDCIVSLAVIPFQMG